MRSLLVSRTTATPASGTTRRNADWPMVSPSWPKTRRPPQSDRAQPRPQWLAIGKGLGTATCGRCISATLAAVRTRVPSGARPSSRCSRAKAAASAAVAQTRPAGPRLRISYQDDAGRGSSPGEAVTCPIAARNRSTSSGRVQVWASPSGAARCSAMAASQTTPVSCSMTRPRMTYPLLQ